MVVCRKYSKIVSNENYPSNYSMFFRERILSGTFIYPKIFSLQNAYKFIANKKKEKDSSSLPLNRIVLDNQQTLLQN